LNAPVEQDYVGAADLSGDLSVPFPSSRRPSMLVRRAAFCGAIASAALAGLPVIALLAGSPSHAAEDELALAREYWRLDALFGGYAVAKQDELETAARNLIRFCSDTPATQMPREKLLTCKTFDAWKAAQKPEAIRKGLEEAQKRELAGKRQTAKEKRRTAARPGEVSLCPPPHKMTHDGCQ
jgi:hypothetical protein